MGGEPVVGHARTASLDHDARFHGTAILSGHEEAHVRFGNACQHFRSAAFRTACFALVAVLLIVPCLWTSGGSVMQASAQLWMQSWMFWAGLGLLALAFIVALSSGADAAMPCLVLALGGVVLTRIVFFTGTVHTAVNLGMPY